MKKLLIPLLSLFLFGGLLSCSDSDGGPTLGDNANLLSLELLDSEGEVVSLDVPFSPYTLTYTVEVESDLEEVTVEAKAQDGNSVVTGDVGKTVTLKEGEETEIEVKVTSENGQRSKIYTIVVSRAAKKSADLASIKLSQGILSPKFDPAVVSYTLSVGNGVRALTATGTADDPKATLGGDNGQEVELPAGETVIVISVTSADGKTEKDYKITVTREGNDDADLASLTVSEGELTPAFGANVLAYTVTVDGSVAKMTVTGVASDDGAKVGGDHGKEITLKGGENKITIKVTAEDGKTKKEYVVTVTRVMHTDATLSDLTVSEGELDPEFDPATLTYEILVPNSVDKITVTGTAADDFATLSKNSGKSTPLVSGTNKIEIVVTAQDGKAKKTYTVNVYREVGLALGSLTVSKGTLTPAFDPNKTAYTVALANNVTSIAVNADAADDNATVEITSDNSLTDLPVGQTTVTITVTAADEGTSQVYTVVLTRAPSTDATLSALSVTGGTLSPAFASGTTSYTLNVENTTTSVTLTATANHSEAIVAGDGVKSGLTVTPNNIFPIEVTAEDGTTKKTYTVTVIRAPSAINTLSDIKVNGVSIPDFALCGDNCEVTIHADSGYVDLIGIPTDPTATVENILRGVVSADPAGNLFTLKVTAENGAEKNYAVTVFRTLSANNFLASISLSSGSLNEPFNPTTTAYTVTVPYKTTSMSVSGTPIHPLAVATSDPAGTVPLNIGSGNLFEIEVIAEDGTPRDYTVTVTRTAPNSDATLATLTTSLGTWNTPFDPAVTDYTVDVLYAVDQVTVTGVLNDTLSRFTSPSEVVKSLNSYPTPSQVTMSVEAEDGTTKTYTLTINRLAPSTNTDLAGITLSTGTLTPVYTNGTMNYTVDVLYSVNSITATATLPGGTLAKFTGESSKTLTGMSIGSGNVITFTVQAEDPTVSTVYTVTVNRGLPSTDATLKSLSLSTGTLTPAFNSGVTAYSSDVSPYVETTRVSATANHFAATVVVNPALEDIPLIDNTINTVTVTVTAEDGTTKIDYVIGVFREELLTDNANLKSITLSSGSLTPSFAASTTSYTVKTGASSMTISGTPEDPVATVGGNNGVAKSLVMGDNAMSLVVTARDGSTQKTYDITVTRMADCEGVAQFKTQQSYSGGGLAECVGFKIVYNNHLWCNKAGLWQLCDWAQYPDCGGRLIDQGECAP